MALRTSLHSVLTGVLGSSNVYFKSPGEPYLKYPCIIYEQGAAASTFADDKIYHRRKRYSVMVIDPNPDSSIPDRVAELPFCSMEKPYIADNLNHYPFTIYY